MPKFNYEKKYPYVCKSKYTGWMPPIKGDAITVLEVRSSDPQGGGAARVCIVSDERHTRIMPYGRISHSLLMEREKYKPSEIKEYMRKAWDEAVPAVAENPVPPRKRAAKGQVASPMPAGRGVSEKTLYAAPVRTGIDLVHHALNLIDQVTREPELKLVFDELYERMGKNG